MAECVLSLQRDREREICYLRDKAGLSDLLLKRLLAEYSMRSSPDPSRGPAAPAVF